MKIDRANKERQRPLTLLAEASPGWLIPHVKINIVTADPGLVAGDCDCPAGGANLALSGCRQLRRILSKKTRTFILPTFKADETLSRLLPTSTMVVAAGDSALFCVRLSEGSDQRSNVALGPETCAERGLGYRDPGQHIRATVNRSATTRQNQGAGSRESNVL